jgi:hypothetical protein
VGAPTSAEGGHGYLYSGASGELLKSFTQNQASIAFGKAVTGAGDIDGDGTPDFAIGAPFADNGFGDSGSVWVYSGRNYALIRQLDGAGASHEFGRSIAGGDVGGDNFSDLVVGAPGSPNGTVYAYSGPILASTGQGAAQLWATNGLAAGDRQGHAVAVVGDRNGDGRGDVVVGSPNAAVPAANAGAASLIDGVTGGELWRRQGAGSGSQLGASIASAGDIDGDGSADAVAGAVNPSGNGYVEVISGRGGFVLYKQVSSFVERFGYSVAAGDTNSDGLAEILVGRPDADVPGPISDAGAISIFRPNALHGANATAVVGRGPQGYSRSQIRHVRPTSPLNVGAGGGTGPYNYSLIDNRSGGSVSGAGLYTAGATAGRIDTVRIMDNVLRQVDVLVGVLTHAPGGTPIGGGASEELGFAVECIGDATGDGLPDYAVGAPGTGGNKGKVDHYNGANNAFVQTTPSSGRGGEAIVGVGDWNGDGRADYAIGEPMADPGSCPGCGRVRVISGNGGGNLHLIPGTQAGEHLGRSLAAADLDGGGITDLIIGVPDHGAAGPNHGRVLVVRGEAGHATLTTIVGDSSGDRLGTSVAAGLDLDGDNKPDFAAAGIGDVGLSRLPLVRGYNGQTYNALGTFNGALGDETGKYLALVGDVNADGRADLIVGRPAVGGTNGAVTAVSGQTFGVIWSQTGASGNFLGTGVAAGADVTGDGIADLAAGGNGLAVRIMNGTNGTQIEQMTAGRAVAACPDLDKDGVPDFVVGDPAFNSSGGQVVVHRSQLPPLVNRPLGVNATPVSDTQIDLAWNDASGNESGFQVEYRSLAGSWQPGPSVGAGVTSASVTGLLLGRRYVFRVRATHPDTASLWSPEILSITMFGAP